MQIKGAPVFRKIISSPTAEALIVLPLTITNAQQIYKNPDVFTSGFLIGGAVRIRTGE